MSEKHTPTRQELRDHINEFGKLKVECSSLEALYREGRRINRAFRREPVKVFIDSPTMGVYAVDMEQNVPVLKSSS